METNQETHSHEKTHVCQCRERERDFLILMPGHTAYLNCYSSHSSSCSLLLHNGRAESVFILFCLHDFIYFYLNEVYNTLCLDNAVRLAEVSARIYLLDTAGPRFWCWEYTLPLLSQELLHLLQWISWIQHRTLGGR